MKALRCTKCGKEKPTWEFFKNFLFKRGYAYWCKDCHYEYRKEWRRKHPEEHKNYYVKIKNKKKQKRRKDKLTIIQALGNKCQDPKCETPNYCSNHPEILGFHHSSGRKESVSEIVLKWKKEKKLPKDVILLCPNCHSLNHSKHIPHPNVTL